MGKTTLVSNFAAHAALIEFLPVAFFSLSLPKKSLAKLILRVADSAAYKEFGSGFLSDKYNLNISKDSNLPNFPIFIDDYGTLSAQDIRARAHSLKQEFDLKLIIVDYIQLIMFSSPGLERREAISEITRTLKALAKELEVCVIVMVQLSRKVRLRGGRPVLYDLMDSGIPEQEADLIMFISDWNDNTSNMVELIVAKQRQGSLGKAILAFNKGFRRFESLEL